MNNVQSEFVERAGRIASLGLGLSVDVYQPDLVELAERLQRQRLTPAYYEVFDAPLSTLRSVRSRLADRPLPCHGEGLWVTQPDWWRVQGIADPVHDAAARLRALKSPWLTIECASKQMAGMSFGTYLPPLYTQAGAMVAADNSVRLQRFLDEQFRDEPLPPPLLLLEMAPLTYFHCGSLSIADFFSAVTQQAPCGLVLDIGHLWTVYRYTDARRRGSIGQFLERFLAVFPLDRVVQIHLAGLAVHPSEQAEVSEAAQKKPGDGLPGWIDAHGAPIPTVLYEMLEQVLHTARLPYLKGMALEVDTKDIGLIASEFALFQDRFSRLFAGQNDHLPAEQQVGCIRPLRRSAADATPVSDALRADVRTQYAEYAGFVTGRAEFDRWADVARDTDADGLRRYREIYLPYEILYWGGRLDDMFPATCRMLAEHAVNIRDFVKFWFDHPRTLPTPYDFFLSKIIVFVEFVRAVLPDAIALVSREAAELQAAYEAANEPAVSEAMPR